MTMISNNGTLTLLPDSKEWRMDFKVSTPFLIQMAENDGLITVKEGCVMSDWDRVDVIELIESRQVL